MQTGIVEWFNEDKGYGVINAANGENVFVHFKSIISSNFRTLNAGDKVEFVIVEGQNGPQAVKVQKI